MISRTQLRGIGNKTGLNLYQQEKDYMLKLFLYNYFRKFDDAIFKGGTCIKYLFATNRFSEDLDFNITISPSEFGTQIKGTLKEISRMGIDTGFIKEEEFADAYTCEIWFHGPLYEGTEQTRNKFRIDAGKRLGTLKEPQWQFIHSEYPETREKFLVYTMHEQEMLVEKIMTLYSRKKGRDLYDTWFLLKHGIKIDPALFHRKVKTIPEWKNMVTREEYERDMKKLTSRILPYEQIRTEIEKELDILRGTQ